MVSYHDLQEWSPELLDEAADALVRHRKTLLDQQDELDIGKVPDTWEGPAAVAATGKHQRLVNSLNDIVAPLSEVIAALDENGPVIKTAQETAKITRAKAIAADYTVDFGADGATVTVTPPADELVLGPMYAAAYASAIQDALSDAATAEGNINWALSRSASNAYDGGTGTLVEATYGYEGSDYEQTQAQMKAFFHQFGRMPESDIDWKTAAMLDPTSYLSKNGGVDAAVQVGRITPQPGRGLVRVGLYIPTDEVFNVPHYDRGDDRGPDPSASPEENRVALYIDYENGLVIARQNPSVDTTGEVRVAAPTVGVEETTTGAVKVTYRATNPFSPPDFTDSHNVEGQFVLSPSANDRVRVDGTITDYPSLEIYQDRLGRETETIATDEADMTNDLGPLLELPQKHDVGHGSDGAEFGQFSMRGRHISGDHWEWTPPGSGTPLGSPEDPPRVHRQDPYESLPGLPDYRAEPV